MSLTVHNHRDGLSDECPRCDFKQKGINWLRDKVDVYPSSKVGYVSVVSRCPMCGERSWAHFENVTTTKILEVFALEMMEARLAQEATVQ